MTTKLRCVLAAMDLSRNAQAALHRQVLHEVKKHLKHAAAAVAAEKRWSSKVVLSLPGEPRDGIRASDEETSGPRTP